MTEGWWINYATRHYLALQCRGVDHEMALRNAENQEWLGIPASVARKFSQYRPRVDRDAMLLYVMRVCPLMRLRGHMTHVSCQYWNLDSDDKPFSVVGRWAVKYAGPGLLLNVSNLATHRNEQVVAQQWSEFVKKQRKNRPACQRQCVKSKGDKTTIGFPNDVKLNRHSRACRGSVE